MTGAVITKVFTDRISDLQTVSGRNATALSQGGQGQWMVPSNWGGNPLDIPNLHLPAFDRTSINGAYLSAQSNGTVGESSCMKLQLDYLSVMERAFRSRHATSVRCLMHTSARFTGQSSLQGIFGAVQGVIQDLLQAAGT